VNIPVLEYYCKTGIFGIFPKEERKFVTFKTGILWDPVYSYKSDNKGKAARGTQLGFPHVALSCKFQGYN